MPTCDLCGKDLGERSEDLRLYTGHLVSRTVQAEGIEAYTAPKIETQYSNKLRPLTVRVCRRHRMDLLKQRAITGFFVFIVIFLPVLFVFGKLTSLVHLSIYYQVAISFALSIILDIFIVRTIRYDSLIAVRLTTRAKQEKSDLEYLTERKFRKITGSRKAKMKSPAN